MTQRDRLLSLSSHLSQLESVSPATQLARDLQACKNLLARAYNNMMQWSDMISADQDNNYDPALMDDIKKTLQ